MQLVRCVACRGEKANAGHALHGTLPDWFLNVACAHAAHDASAVLAVAGSPANPGRHSHCATCTLAFCAVSEKLWHRVHGALSSVGLKNPRGHAVHCPPSAPENPGTHRQSVTTVLPLACVDVCDGHSKQAELPTGA